MQPIDFRNETWRDIANRIGSDCEAILAAYRTYGPSTTRQLAEMTGISILTVRPRTTDLYQLGAVSLVDRRGKEGVYAARTDAEWMLWYGESKERALRGDQMQLL